MEIRAMKLQAAVDFLSSYGLAMVVMIMALIVFYLFTSSTNTQSVYCNPAPGFSCDYYSYNSMGVLTIRLSQALGTQITIEGAACSTQQNYSTDTPAYGNVYVSNGIGYYARYAPGNIVYSSGYYIFYLYCYDAVGLAQFQVGKPFSGYVWLNYSIPNYGNQVQKVATFSVLSS
ncbi:MAG: hypothetical protein KGH64_05255 [Candidatus Micrarchaeota archaeon]|nr:hypothetical protein [Candidatus Micrarchaeota archaeon]MDE1834716.1 hypothetical protein [Candidatus Micrarchaeota archaeon]MDE1859019.1 hypothetical protein [Candidatus Micrarchaeota archaeon]